jgi:hypothetical protein
LTWINLAAKIGISLRVSAARNQTLHEEFPDLLPQQWYRFLLDRS